MGKAPAHHCLGRPRKLLRALAGIENGVLVGLLAAMIVLAVGQVVLRNLFSIGFVWTDPVTRLLVLWVGLMGAMVASRNDEHINMDIVSRWLPAPLQRFTHVVTSFFTFAVCAAVAYNAGRLVYFDYRDGLMVFGFFPAWIAETIVPFGFAVIGLRYLLRGSAAPDTVR